MCCPKRRYLTANQRCVTFQESEDLIYAAAVGCNYVVVVVVVVVKHICIFLWCKEYVYESTWDIICSLMYVSVVFMA
jgi:hypothetical protein